METRFSAAQLAVPLLPRRVSRQKGVRAGGVVGRPAEPTNDGATLRVGQLNSSRADRAAQLAYAALFVAGAGGIIHALAVLADFLPR